MSDRLKDWELRPAMAPKDWPQQRGRAFERILKRMLDKEGLEPRGVLRPSGEEVDGAFYLGGRTYLLEAKWRADPIPASDLYAFKGKVDGKLVGTLGVFVSMSGYSKDAIDALKAGKEINLILFDAEDIRLVDDGILSFAEAMKRKLRYAAEEGQPYRPLGSDKVGATTTSVLEFTTPREDELESRPDGDPVWDVVVEGRADEVAMRVIFDRIGAGDKVRFWSAGGQLGVPSLVRRMQESGHARIAAIVEPDLPEKTQEELKQLFQVRPHHMVVIDPNIEEWLEGTCPADYINAVPPTGIKDKAARRISSNADIGLVIQHPAFAELLREILGDQFDLHVSKFKKD